MRAIADHRGSAIAESGRKHLTCGLRAGDLVEENTRVRDCKVATFAERVGQEGEGGIAEEILWGRGGEKGTCVDQEERAVRITAD